MLIIRGLSFLNLCIFRLKLVNKLFLNLKVTMFALNICSFLGEFGAIKGKFNSS